LVRGIEGEEGGQPLVLLVAGGVAADLGRREVVHLDLPGPDPDLSVEDVASGVGREAPVVVELEPDPGAGHERPGSAGLGHRLGQKRSAGQSGRPGYGVVTTARAEQSEDGDGRRDPPPTGSDATDTVDPPPAHAKSVQMPIGGGLVAGAGLTVSGTCPAHCRP
jgi:hypothetical protein